METNINEILSRLKAMLPKLNGNNLENVKKGLAFYEGRGVQQDYAQAAAWFTKAAEQGLAQAQSNLGLMYANGQGVPQDDAQAVAWYQKAAEQGFAQAQSNLGEMYYFGHGVKKNDVKAYMWTYLAASQGLEEAIKFLASLVKVLTPSQIQEAERLTRKWLAAHPQARGE